MLRRNVKAGDLVSLVTQRRVRGTVVAVFPRDHLAMVRWKATYPGATKLIPLEDVAVLA